MFQEPLHIVIDTPRETALRIPFLGKLYALNDLCARELVRVSDVGDGARQGMAADLFLLSDRMHAPALAGAGLPVAVFSPDDLPALRSLTPDIHLALDFDRTVAVSYLPHKGGWTDCDSYAAQRGVFRMACKEFPLRRTPADGGPLYSFLLKYSALSHELAQTPRAPRLHTHIVTARWYWNLWRMKTTLRHWNCSHRLHFGHHNSKGRALAKLQADLFIDDQSQHIQNVRARAPHTLAAHLLPAAAK